MICEERKKKKSEQSTLRKGDPPGSRPPAVIVRSRLAKRRMTGKRRHTVNAEGGEIVGRKTRGTTRSEGIYRGESARKHQHSFERERRSEGLRDEPCLLRVGILSRGGAPRREEEVLLAADSEKGSFYQGLSNHSHSGNTRARWRKRANSDDQGQGAREDMGGKLPHLRSAVGMRDTVNPDKVPHTSSLFRSPGAR